MAGAPWYGSLREKFEARVNPEPNTGCWLWSGHCHPTGYGTLTYHNITYRGSRLSYEFYKGKIPDGMDVCHKCDNPPCVNPDHLFLGTRKDNMQDAKRKSRLSSGERHWNYSIKKLPNLPEWV